jgi:hypothetical protein
MYANHHDERGRNQISPDDTAFKRNFIANKSKAIKQGSNLILYDGFMMQRLLGNLIHESENSIDNVHIVLDSRLTSLNVALKGFCHKYLFALALTDIVFHPFNYGFTVNKAC